MIIIKKVNILSLAKIGGIIYACFGFIVGAVFSFCSILGREIPQIPGISGAEIVNWTGVAALFILPFIYGIAGIIAGFLMGFLFNLACRSAGGLKIETE